MQAYVKDIDLAVQQFLLKLPEEKRTVAVQLRDLILSVNPAITEAIKWGNLTFVINKVNLAFIYTYKQVDYINLGFLQAVKLSDPKKLFEGTGKGMRHIKVKTLEDIPAAQIKRWVKEAVLLESNL